MASKAPEQFLNLFQLQNLIKRDPKPYKDEFLLQYQHYHIHMEDFRLQPDKFAEPLKELVMFLTQVSHCYGDEVKGLPEDLCAVLQTHGTASMNKDMRMTFCKALIQLRNKGLAPPSLLLHLSFDLAKCQDKELRKTLFNYVVRDLSRKQWDNKTNSNMKMFLSTKLRAGDPVITKMSLDIMMELYRKNVWNDEKTVNIMATACFSKTTKVMVAAIQFFLGTNAKGDDGGESDSSDDGVAEDRRHVLQQMRLSSRVGKKSKKKKRKIDKALEDLKKKRKQSNRAPVCNFSALQLLNNPQGMADRLFQQLTEGKNEKFEVKLMCMDLISRLVGLHQLILLNFYPHLTRLLKPHQREVTKILLYLSQASHDLVPPDYLEEALKEIANNFITERNSTEVIAVGLNAVREICSRCPLAMSECLLQDLTQYSSHRDKNVYMAARSLIGLFRRINPTMLMKKDRGRPSETEPTPSGFASLHSQDYLPGAEVLAEEPEGDPANQYWDSTSSEDDDDDDEDEWIDVSHSSEDEQQDSEAQAATKLTAEERLTKARMVTQSRVLTQEEFDKIRRCKAMTRAGLVAPGTKKTHKRKAEESELNKTPAEYARLASACISH